MPVYTIGIVGESKANPDGSERQSEIARCMEGELVVILPEPENPYDPFALRVLSVRGVQIGYIGRDNNEWIGDRLSRGAKIYSFIYRLTGGVGDRHFMGVVLAIGININGLEDFRELFESDSAYQEWLMAIQRATEKLVR